MGAMPEKTLRLDRSGCGGRFLDAVYGVQPDHTRLRLLVAASPHRDTVAPGRSARTSDSGASSAGLRDLTMSDPTLSRNPPSGSP